MIDFAKISPGLFVGSCPSTDMDIRQLKAMGVTGVLSLQTDADFVKWDINFEEIQQASYTYDLVIQRFPIIDFDDDDLRQHLLSAVDTLHRMIAVGHTMYVHCTAGQERAPSVVAGYLIRHKNFTFDQAKSQLVSARTCAPKMHVIETVVNDRTND